MRRSGCTSSRMRWARVWLSSQLTIGKANTLSSGTPPATMIGTVWASVT